MIATTESSLAATDSLPLWRVSVVLVAALGVVFSLPRAKPVWIFAVGFGIGLGLLALYLARVLRVRIGWRNAGLVGFCAAVAVWSAVLVAITRQYRHERPKDDLVQKLFQQLPADHWENGAVPGTLTWSSHTTFALRQRIGDPHPHSSRWLWVFIAEGVAAGVIAAGMLSVGRFRSSRPPSNQEAAS